MNNENIIRAIEQKSMPKTHETLLARSNPINKEQTGTKDRVDKVLAPASALSSLTEHQNQVLNAIEDPNLEKGWFEKTLELNNRKKIAKAETKLTIAANQTLINAEKAGNISNQAKLSEFNQRRVAGYTNAIGTGSKGVLGGIGAGLGIGAKKTLTLGGEGIGNFAKTAGKDLLNMAAGGAKELGAAGLSIIKGGGEAVKYLAKLGIETMWDAWYSSWEAYNNYRKKNPKT